MSFLSRYVSTTTRGQELNVFKIVWHSVVALFLLILVISYWPFQSVPTGSRGVVTQFGRIIRIENEGLAILTPFQKMAIFNIRAEKADIDNADGSTSDQQPVKVSLTVRYSITPVKVAEVYEKYSKDGDLSSYIQTAAQEVFKAVTAKYTAPNLIAQRAQVSADINTLLKAKIAPYGAQVLNIDMRNFTFNDTYMHAINEKVTQEQLRLGAENKLKTVIAQQQQKVAIAHAEADAIKARADGDAYATLTNAKAQADALEVQNAALAKNHDVLELRKIEVEMKKASRWDGKLPVQMLGSTPMPFMKIEEK